jgi:carbonic anhydrase/acetyltransferase-like protein (isoleucine patch superfamily)
MFPRMPVYRLGDLVPSIHPDAFVHPDAVVIGNVTLGAESSVWPGAVLRGDYGVITIGARSSIQDGSVLHATPLNPTIVGAGCVVGHLVHLEGCTLEDDSLAGSGSVVLHDAVVGTGATVAANAVVPNRMKVPPGALAVGIPAKFKEGASDLELIRLSADEYVTNAIRYREQLEHLA